MSSLLDPVAFGRIPLPRVLFDANVLFQAAATRFLLGGARAGLYRAIWTAEIVDEARRNLTEARRLGGLAALDQILQFVRDALVEPASGRQAELFPATHVDDRHVLAAAVKHSAAVLVTDNVRDFDVSEAASGNVVIATAREFASHLARRDADAMTRFIERVPPERFERYVAALKRQFPEAMDALEL